MCNRSWRPYIRVAAGVQLTEQTPPCFVSTTLGSTWTLNPAHPQVLPSPMLASSAEPHCLSSKSDDLLAPSHVPYLPRVYPPLRASSAFISPCKSISNNPAQRELDLLYHFVAKYVVIGLLSLFLLFPFHSYHVNMFNDRVRTNTSFYKEPTCCLLWVSHCVT